MRTTLRRPLIALAVAGTVLATAISGTAVARPFDQQPAGQIPAPAALPNQDLGMADRRDNPTSSLAGTVSEPAARENARRDLLALAQQEYYAKYQAGLQAPEPVAPAPEAIAPAPSPGTDWLPIALAIAATLAVMALAAGVQHRRHRTVRIAR